MLKIPEEVQTAVALAPLIRRLNELGITNMDGGTIQLTDKLFHTAFHTWYTEPCKGLYEYRCHNVNGVKVYCVARKGEPSNV